MKIFDCHFIKRYLERRASPGLSPYQVIVGFPLYDETRLVEHFTQNEHWYLYLDISGIAMIKNEPPILHFDTFITLLQLKETQKTAIKEYLEKLKDLSPLRYLVLLHEIRSNSEWERDYFPKESIDDAITKLNDEQLKVLKSCTERGNT